MGLLKCFFAYFLLFLCNVRGKLGFEFTPLVKGMEKTYGFKSIIEKRE
jgi:hypothetical protein